MIDKELKLLKRMNACRFPCLYKKLCPRLIIRTSHDEHILMTKKFVDLPYFDYLLAAIRDNKADIESSFGRHVHWGYWEQPYRASLSGEDFSVAAERLSTELCIEAQLNNGQQIADIGCGFGGTIALLNGKFNSMRLFGLNLDDRQLQRAKQMLTADNGNVIQLLQGNACTLPYADASFDAVLAVECIFHFPNRERFFHEAIRVLKPGGCLVLSDFIPVRAILPLFKLELSKALGTGFYGSCHVDCTKQDYRSLAAKTGFEVKAERDITVNTLPTYRYLRKLGAQNGLANKSAQIETFTIEVLSRLKLLKYFIYSFQKPLK